ncbi:28034_t:CDS:2, partial [Gigaspora margarita]
MSESTFTNENVSVTQESEVPDKLSSNNEDSPPIIASNVLNDPKNAFPTSGRFVQIIDVPKENNQIIQNNQNNQNIHNVQNNTINNLSPKVIHLLDATTEDPFTLETFETLIHQHSDKDKDFILARVTTADPLDDSKIYNSYYSAHHINKVLFRTQPEQGLLHRMKAKNPLNNMNIIGDVYYYVVKAESFKPIQSSTSPLTVQTKNFLLENGVPMAEISATSALDTNEGDYLINIDPDKTIHRESGLHSSPPSIWQDDRDVDDPKNSIIIKNNERRRSENDLIQPPLKVFHFQSKKHSSSSLPPITPDNIQLHEINSTSSVSNHQININTVSNPLSSNTFEISRLPNSYYKFEHTKYNVPHNFYIQNPVSLSPSLTNPPSSISPNLINSNVHYYQAIFYATDDDFLMKSSVRQYFKYHALDSSDTQLFIINASQSAHATGTLNATPPSSHLERIIANNGTFVDDSTTNSRNGSNSAGGSRWARQLRNIRSNKGLK